jgi:hypothetical protein
MNKISGITSLLVLFLAACNNPAQKESKAGGKSSADSLAAKSQPVSIEGFWIDSAEIGGDYKEYDTNLNRIK